MGRSNHRKSRYESRLEQDLGDEDEGTSARTRPLSFDEIMLKRKSKKVSESCREENKESGDDKKNDNVLSSSIHNVCDKDDNGNDISAHHLKGSTDFVRRADSTHKEEKMSMNDGRHGRSKNRETLDSKSEVNNKGDSDVIHSTESSDRFIVRHRVEDRSVNWHDSEKQHSKDIKVEDRYKDNVHEKYEHENSRKPRNGADGPEAEDRHLGRSTGKLERDKRKDRNRDDGPKTLNTHVDRGRGKSERGDKRNQNHEEGSEAQDKRKERSGIVFQREDKKDGNGDAYGLAPNMHVDSGKGMSDRDDKRKDKNQDVSKPQDRHLGSGRLSKKEDRRRD